MSAHLFEECSKSGPEVVIGNLAGLGMIVHVIGWIGKDHIGRMAFKESVKGLPMQRVATD